MSESKAHALSSERWMLAHALVAIDLAVFVYMLFLNFRYADAGRLPQPTPSEYLLIALGVPSALWGWMLTDSFHNKTGSKSVAWGWFLVLGNWLAAVVYFFVVWRPRHART